MFETMAAAAGAKPAARGVAHSVFRIMANSSGGSGSGSGSSRSSAEASDASSRGSGGGGASRRAYADVVKADATASLDRGARLQHRGVGELQDEAKVTSLLGVWQQRLQQQQQRQQQQRQRQQQLRARQHQVWQRQQQLLKQHGQRRDEGEGPQNAQHAPHGQAPGKAGRVSAPNAIPACGPPRLF
ncbi:hypothetical protein MNEG_14799 [Monoraphidium neglectum]|uniref:Uncharacterized protein n=1 Tax=Monoraphidium neglectum TaxID=145388 RepID=A0A0D2LN17_9CHLO|nr:hypothetical protein MNEG_14799 [Monoraphidium neglectum]KIY93164.1 hypothetical protein MNEG_14799 [Monoraphidium neglectum]|eukprot:XP_013892184.1 hypothetical protein MNEG_14799 [Monoraphidium neglectum]